MRRLRVRGIPTAKSNAHFCSVPEPVIKRVRARIKKKEKQFQLFSERNRITDHFADAQLFLCRSARISLPAVRGTPLLLTDR